MKGTWASCAGGALWEALRALNGFDLHLDNITCRTKALDYSSRRKPGSGRLGVTKYVCSTVVSPEGRVVVTKQEPIIGGRHQDLPTKKLHILSTTKS